MGKGRERLQQKQPQKATEQPRQQPKVRGQGWMLAGAEFDAWFREGRNDLADAILRPFPDTMQLNREMGAPGSPTHGEVFRDRTGIGLDAPADAPRKQKSREAERQIEPEM